MKLADLWSPRTKFIEFDPHDGAIGAALRRQGCARFLAVTGSEKRQEAIATEHPELARQVAVTRGPLPVRGNNADVLILSGGSSWRLWRFRDLGHAQFVAWRPRPSIATCFAVLACLLQLLVRRICWVGVVRLELGGPGSPLLVFRVRHPKAYKAARRYIPNVLGVEGLLRRFSESRFRYAVLRWFESLPDIRTGEDLDLLVDDDHLPGVWDVLDEGPGIQPCDVYSVTGLPGSDYREMPYFPPHLAAALLDEARTHASLALVPSPQHHFLSLAYHVVYHKGATSGLLSRDRRIRSPQKPEHNYAGALRALAEELGVNIRLTLEDLDEYLHTQAWRPPRDMLVRLVARRRGMRGLVRSHPEGPDDSGLAVFLIREAALARGSLDHVVGMIEHEGFQILKTKMLMARESRLVARTIRGGNWGRGPWPACGGLPAAAVVTYDPEPIPVSVRDRKRYPELTNARLLCKSKLRAAFNSAAPDQEPCNVLHSSDNGHEALEYLQIIMPEALAEVRSQVARIKRCFATEQPVILKLTNYRRRAKTEVIEFQGQLAVKKTFKPHQRRYCEREARAMRRLSRVVSEIPPLLAANGDSVVYPYYDDVLRFRRSSGMLLPLGVARQAIAALQAVYEAGFALIDAHPENLIVDRRHGLKLIDFEFLHRYEIRPACFQESYDIAGCPPEFAGSLPDGGAKCYARHWQPYIGLSLRSLLYDPPWLQHMRRGVYCLVALPWMLPRRLRYVCLSAWRAITTPGRVTGLEVPTPMQPQTIVGRERRVA